MRGTGHLRETGEMRAGFWWVDLREREQLEDLGVDGKIILKRIFEKRDGEAFRVLMGRPDGKRTTGRIRRRWKDNIKTDLREEGWRGIQGFDG